MATIRKRNGKYQVQIRRLGSAAVSKTFSSKIDAEAWARRMELHADDGMLPSSLKLLDQYTVRNVLERYMREITIHKKGAEVEKFIIKGFLKSSLADLTFKKIATSHFSEYRDQRIKKVKPGTVNREFQIIKHAFDLAEREWGIPLKANPLAKLKKLKVKNARSRRLSKEEYDLLIRGLEQTRNARIRPFIDFAIETGMRRGEMLNMRWDDIDFNKRTLFIEITKNGESRTIPLSSRAIDILKALQNSDNSSVFNLTQAMISKAWKRLVKRAGIIDLHFHDLRHEAISRFFEKGLSIAEVALISGHKDFRMLFRYTHMKAEEVALKLK